MANVGDGAGVGWAATAAGMAMSATTAALAAKMRDVTAVSVL